MRARTHSVAHLPATSVIATAVLTVAWWLTLAGLTTAAPIELVPFLVAGAIGTTVIAVGSDPRARACLVTLLVAFGRTVRRKPPPGVAVRWSHQRIDSITLCRNEIETVHMGRPRAPGRVAPTA